MIKRIQLKKIPVFLFSILLANAASAQEITAGMEKIRVLFNVDAKGTPVYSVSFGQKVIIQPSQLGFIFSNDDAFNSNFEITASEKRSVDEPWKPVWGETGEIRNHYEQVTVHLKQSTSNRLLDI